MASKTPNRVRSYKTLIGLGKVVTITSFEDEIASLRETMTYGSYEYSNVSEKFTHCTTLFFKRARGKKRYGIYIVRQRDTKEVLYVGKSGTIDYRGHFKGQDIPGRLKNVKEGDVSANKWFKRLLQEKGPLTIEYILLSRSVSPALVEVALLQGYLNENHCLPYRNKSL